MSRVAIFWDHVSDRMLPVYEVRTRPSWGWVWEPLGVFGDVVWPYTEGQWQVGLSGSPLSLRWSQPREAWQYRDLVRKLVSVEMPLEGTGALVAYAWQGELLKVAVGRIFIHASEASESEPSWMTSRGPAEPPGLPWWERLE